MKGASLLFLGVRWAVLGVRACRKSGCDPFLVLILSCSSVFCNRMLKQEGPWEKPAPCAWTFQFPRTVTNKPVLSNLPISSLRQGTSALIPVILLESALPAILRIKMLCVLACLCSSLIFPSLNLYYIHLSCSVSRRAKLLLASGRFLCA